MDADRLVSIFPFSFMRVFFAKASPPGSPSAIQAFALNATNQHAIAVQSGFNAALALRGRSLLAWVNLHLSNQE